MERDLQRAKLQRVESPDLRQLRHADTPLRRQQRHMVRLVRLHGRGRVSAERRAIVRFEWHAGVRRELSVGGRVHRSDLRRRDLADLRQLRLADAHLRSCDGSLVGVVCVHEPRRVQARCDSNLWLAGHADLRSQLSVG
jgi:hypothetical protein